MLTDVLYRLRALFRGNTVETELDEELRFHFVQQVDKYVRAGLTRAEAVRQARRLEQRHNSRRISTGSRQSARSSSATLARSPGQPDGGPVQFPPQRHLGPLLEASAQLNSGIRACTPRSQPCG